MGEDCIAVVRILILALSLATADHPAIAPDLHEHRVPHPAAGIRLLGMYTYHPFWLTHPSRTMRQCLLERTVSEGSRVAITTHVDA